MCIRTCTCGFRSRYLACSVPIEPIRYITSLQCGVGRFQSFTRFLSTSLTVLLRLCSHSQPTPRVQYRVSAARLPLSTTRETWPTRVIQKYRQNAKHPLHKPNDSLTQSPGLRAPSTTNLQPSRIQHSRNPASNVPALSTQDSLSESLPARPKPSHNNLQLLDIPQHAPLLHRLERESRELVRSIVAAATRFPEPNVTSRNRQQHVDHLLLVRGAGVRGRNAARSGLRGRSGRLHQRQVRVVLGGQDVQAVRLLLAGGVEVAAGGFVVDLLRGRRQDVFQRIFARVAVVGAAARVIFADVLQA